MASVFRPRVFLDVSINDESAGRLVIELFTDKTPKTCENFRALCTGSHPPLTYKQSPFHRIIDEFMVQGGDITKGDGTGGDSIYGGDFEDENIGWRAIDEARLVCMANRGKNTDSSQFFITLAPCEHLNEKHTVFGHLVAGQDVLDRMAKVKVDRNDKPEVPVVISHCGELERRKKAQELPTKATTEGRERNDRRRTSSASRSRSPSRRHHRHHSNSRSPSPAETDSRKRRRSDYDIDGTFRGRPRKRSRSRTKYAIPEDRVPHRHHRRRSPSPSRSAKREDDRSRSKSPGFRRRRSLPNHYDKRADRYRHPEEDYRLKLQEEERDGGRDRYEGAMHDDRDRLAYRGGRDDGRLGGGGFEDEPAIKYKGRGSMKFRERWRQP